MKIFDVKLQACRIYCDFCGDEVEPGERYHFFRDSKDDSLKFACDYCAEKLKKKVEKNE